MITITTSTMAMPSDFSTSVIEASTYSGGVVDDLEAEPWAGSRLARSAILARIACAVARPLAPGSCWMPTAAAWWLMIAPPASLIAR